MKTLYFDCFAGASGDMILGALTSAGAEPRALLEQLALLGVSNYEIDFETVDRSGISATRALVRTGPEKAHRHLSDIHKIIRDSHLGEGVKERAALIFTRLAEAEARVHNQPVERIHFHEVGALDAIIDVVGACICFELLGIERFVSSSLHVGSGMVEMAHGRFPVPPPAVAELLKDAPIYSSDIVGELLTPTGAAIISTVCQEFGPLPAMRIERTGYGAGGREYEGFPNALRVIVGEDEDERLARRAERLLMIETNIDDMSPQLFGYLMERAFERGALDCYFTPVQMKKNRPGLLVNILCRPSEEDALCELLFNETTTLGIRSYEVKRRFLERENFQVQTLYGPINVKVARVDEGLKFMPEYEQCREAAVRAGVSLRQVEAAARAAFASLRSVLDEESSERG
ncbi:MAG TPA: nickel pincer cofactor biosynthesis protein LarC [Pyrinomonadaceae bacterium]